MIWQNLAVGRLDKTWLLCLQGGSFKATGLLQQAEKDGQNGAASPAEPDAASADQQEDMVNLPEGWQPAQIPQRYSQGQLCNFSTGSDAPVACAPFWFVILVFVHVLRD